MLYHICYITENRIKALSHNIYWWYGMIEQLKIVFEQITIERAKIKEVSLANGEKIFVCQKCSYGSQNLKATERHIRTHEHFFVLTCGVCGKITTATKENFWERHLAFREHIREHSNETKDLFGKPISFGYGWTDSYLAVKEIKCLEELQKHLSDIAEIKNKNGVVI